MTQGSKQRLLLTAIRLDGGTQARVNMRHEETIDEYASKYKEGIEMPLPVVFYDEDKDINWLADGFQRYFAHEKNGEIEIDCEVRSGDQRAAILYAVGANEEHGLKRTVADRRKAVMILLNDKDWSDGSSRQIASMAKVSPWLVNELRKELESSSTGSSASEPRKVKCSDGREMNVSRISEANKERHQPTRTVASDDDGYSGSDEEVYEHDQPDDIGESEPVRDEPDDATEESSEDSAVESNANAATAGEVFKEAMAEVPKFKELIKALDELKKTAYDLSEGPAGHYMAWNRIEIDFKNLRTHIKDSIPVDPCEVCNGDGCSSCRMGGFIVASYAKGLKQSA